jgi:hypothetical protein
MTMTWLMSESERECVYAGVCGGKQKDEEKPFFFFFFFLFGTSKLRTAMLMRDRQ